MGEECSDCRKWEEDIYWTHFQSVQFFQFLSGSFDHQLAIPKKFANNLREKLAETVSLKGPSGTIWNVGLTASGDALLFKHGWKEFVEDHSLEEDDVLIFKYNGDSRFDVLMFDRRSFCEKEASYFVKRCGHMELDTGCGTKRNITDSFEVTANSSQDAVGGTPPKKLRTRAKGMIRRGAVRSSTTIGSYHVQFVSNRRPITKEEKENALKLAQAASTKDSFVIVMRLSHVYKGFYMSIPAEWATTHLPRKSQDVILRVGEKTWHARFYYRVHGGGLTGGWKNFAVENFLEEFDACLFELSSGTDDANILDVRIFRVVEEVIPPTRLPYPTSRGRTPSKNPRRK